MVLVQCAVLVFSCLIAQICAIDNGLGLKPPMGWRSWNLYGENVNQSQMVRIMDGMVARKRLVDGRPTSLCDLGYCDVGLDDNWQACGKGSRFYKYHAWNQSGSVYSPVVNTERFPDMAAMTQHAHSLGLTAGWYGNNCICREHLPSTRSVYEGDVRALVKFGFDGIKLDYCGTQTDLNLWAELLNKTGRPVMIENCHWGWTVPTQTWCPWNFYRTSPDLRASYGSVVGNLMSAMAWGQRNLSRPGCWAYPDGLQVGVRHGAGGQADPGLSLAEARAHFGAWCIVSSPLTLAYDVNNDTIADQVWPIVSNVDAIAVNQAWVGHSGFPFKQANHTVKLAHYSSMLQGKEVEHTSAIPSWQYLYKRLAGSRVAVLLMNHGKAAQELQLDFADVPGLGCSSCYLRDVWQRSDLGLYERSLTVVVESHDAAFFIISPSVATHPLVV